jgi:23S rRNA (uracil1939-C5)-methyltransferase
VGQGVRDGPALTTSVTIEKLVPGGAGFCRLPDGRAAFVEGALPGDRVEVRAFEEKRGYVRATAFELVEPSADRVEPPCPIARTCGGCDWMHLDLGAQRRHKARLVAEALERTGRLRLAAVPDVVVRGNDLGYRSRVRVHVDEHGTVGFFGRRTRSLVPVPACAVAHPALNRALGVLASLTPPHRALLAKFEAAELSVPGDDTGTDVRLWPRRGEAQASSVELLIAELRARGLSPFIAAHATSKGAAAPGEERPWAMFSQVNRDVNEALVTSVTEGAAARGVRSFLDLYGGRGNFTLPLAKGDRSGVLVELDRAAARDAAHAANELGLSVKVLPLDAERAVEQLAKSRERFELVVLDPPRAGAKGALPGIATLRPRAIAYVSCDPVTLARDLKELVLAGYRLESVRCFDMFPHTHHVETLAWLDRA